MGPQNNFSPKHNSLTKSSAGFSARGKTSFTVSMTGGQKILSKRFMVNFEDLKTHIAEFEPCQQHLHTKFVPPVIFSGTISGKMKP